MHKRLKELAQVVQGELVGDPNLEIEGVASIEEAQKGDLTFALEPQAVPKASSTSASAILTPLGTEVPKKSIIRVKNPRLAMAQILELFAPIPKIPKGVHKTAILGKGTKIGKDVYIQAYVTVGENAQIGNRVVLYPGVYIGNGVSIGDDTLIYPNVTLYDRVSIGKKVIIHGGTVIGADGYGYVPHQGKYVKIPQIGRVIIDDEVEIGANVAIDRATLGATYIGKGTKIDNQTHIAHNCVIGEHCAITGHVAFAGGVTLKDGVSVGGQAGFAGHITIGENTIVMGRSGVTKSLPPGSVVSGLPAQEHRQELKIEALIRRLPQLFNKVAELEKSLKSQ